MARMVAGGELDCSLLDPLPGKVPGLRVLRWSPKRSWWPARRAIRFTSERDVTLERLSREPFIETDPSWTTRIRTDSAFAAAGLISGGSPARWPTGLSS